MRPQDLNPRQQEDFLRAFGDHETFCRECLRLADRVGSRVPLDQWPSQRKLTAAIESQERAGLPVRILTLKTRRSGFTVGSCSHIFRRVPFFSGRKGIIIADRYDPAALEAFDYIKQFQAHYQPLTVHGARLRMPRLVSDTEMKLVWENDSELEVYSADRGEIRGGGRHWALFDELAFWRNPRLTLRGAMNMIPDLPETGIIVQSTANGQGDEFWSRCQRARDVALNEGFLFVFFGWLEDPNNWRPFATPEERERFLKTIDQEEYNLQRMHGATPEQLNWRRWKIRSSLNGSVDDFHQEYPTSAEEAFLTSGRPALDHAAIARMPVQEGTTGELEELETYPKKRIVFHARGRGALTIWKPPQEGHWYVAGGDPSKGKDVSESKRGDDPDWSVVIVLDGETGEQVAQLRERLRPMPFGEYFALLCRWYNWAYMVPESNDPGVIDAVLKTNYPLERIYREQRDPSDRRSASLDEIGYYTTESSRNRLIGALDAALINGDIGLHSAIAVQECRTFVVKTGGRREHQTGCHDDCVFAAGLAVMGLRTAPRHVMTRPPEAAAAVRPSRWGRAIADDDDSPTRFRR